MDFTDLTGDINFPEGPLVYNQPRPDSSDNQFCLSCHSADSKGGLGLDALSFDRNLTHAEDPRRQPLEPVARVFGNIPENWLGTGVPRRDLVAPAEGFSIDEMLHFLNESRAR